MSTVLYCRSGLLNPRTTEGCLIRTFPHATWYRVGNDASPMAVWVGVFRSGRRHGGVWACLGTSGQVVCDPREIGRPRTQFRDSRARMMMTDLCTGIANRLPRAERWMIAIRIARVNPSNVVTT